MSKIHLDELKAALEQRRPQGGQTLKESDYKRRLVAEVNRLPGGRARRIEDRFAVGVLDLIIKLPDRPMVLAEGKLIEGNFFAPTSAQFEEGKKWEAAGINCLLLGWKHGQLYISHWVEKADYRACFANLDINDAQALMEYLL